MAGKPRKRKPRPRKRKQKKSKSAQRPPVPPPRNAQDSTNAQQIDRTDRNHSIDDENKGEVKRMDWSIILSVVFTGVVAAATVCLVVTAACQLNAIYSQIQQTQEVVEIMRQEQRAWLGVIQPTMSELIAGQPIDCQIPIKNTGRTPGTVKSAAFGIYFVPADADAQKIMDIVRGFPNPEQRETVVAPDVIMRMKISNTTAPTESIVSAVKDGTISAYVVGIFSYSDIFGNSHETQFCFDYDRSSKGLLAYEKYNYMD